MTMQMQVSLRQQLMERVRYFNKRYLNPFTLSFAGRPHSPYAIVQHVGRKSGCVYATPVLAMAVEDHFVIPLPYGKHVDWCRNVLAAESCTIGFQGHAYRVGESELVGPSEGLPAFPQWTQSMLVRAETAQFLRLKRLSASPEDDAEYRRLIAAYPIDRAVWTLVAGLLGVFILLRLFKALRSRK